MLILLPRWQKDEFSDLINMYCFPKQHIYIVVNSWWYFKMTLNLNGPTHVSINTRYMWCRYFIRISIWYLKPTTKLKFCVIFEHEFSINMCSNSCNKCDGTKIKSCHCSLSHLSSLNANDLVKHPLYYIWTT